MLVAQVAFIYTPTNAAILAVLAGLIGGCASRLYWAAQQASERSKLAVAPPGGAAAAPAAEPATPSEEAGSLYLRESPAASQLRAFLAYTVLIAGLMTFSPKAFVEVDAETYIRIAGMVSALAFAVGYDPRKITSLLGSVSSNSAGKSPG